MGGMMRPNPGGDGDARPGRLSSDDIRQFRGEARQWAAEAEQLRRKLRNQKMDPKTLDEVLRGLRVLEADEIYRKPADLAQLQASVADSMKRFEYELRRRIDGNANDVFLSNTDEVPEAYRKLVEQYYRALAKGGR